MRADAERRYVVRADAERRDVFFCGAGAQASQRDWIVRKKQQQRTRGYTSVKPDSKYTGRKRKDRF